MKKLMVGAIVLASVLALLRFFGPVLGRRVMTDCENMFRQLPDDFPPKRMMHSLEEIREQNTQILQHLEQAEHQHTAKAPSAGSAEGLR